MLPDISIAGYVFGNKYGAIIYNLFHNKVTGLILYLLGVMLGLNFLMLAGLIVVAHSALDHFFGYGFKSFKGFKHTSLGEIGN